MVTIVDCTIIALYERHEVTREIPGKVVHEFRLGKVKAGIAVGHDYDHLLCFSLCNQVIQDEVDPSDLEECFLCIRCTADKIEYRIILL